jgi:hypothetical protein
MTLRNGWRVTWGRFLGVVTALIVLAGCGGGGSPSSSTSQTTANNTLAVEVNLGPANNYVNGIFATVTVCVPGTSTCQSIPNILVDTGSYGLRLLSSQVSVSLPQTTQSGNSSNVLQECVTYADGSYTWGQVVTADIEMAGEKASAVPVQLISAPNTGLAVPSACTSGGGPNDGTVDMLDAYGILGVGGYPYDCGDGCTSASSAVSPYPYYICSTSTGLCGVTSVPLANQVQNPVWLFPQDNNGVVLVLPSVPAGGQATASGSLIFGVATQSDNALGEAQIYATDSYGNFTTTYNGVAYSQSFIDSGSNAIDFLDSATLGNIDCSDNPGWYCPASTLNFTVSNTGYNGVGQGSVEFSIANADTLFKTGFAAFNNLGGDSGSSIATDYFDFGLPFFFGRSMFVGIAGTTVPNGVSAPYGYWAY